MGSYHYTSTSHFFFAGGGGGGGEGEYSSYKGTGSTDTHRPTTVRIPVTTPDDAAAARIQAAFRGHLVRRHAAAVRGADAEATRLERLLRRQETVDAVRGDERERARFSEALMAVLLRLDAVPGYYPAVREARRAVTRRVVGLQEVFDAVLAAPDAADTCGVPASLDQVLEGIWGESPDAPPPPPPPAVAVEEEVVRSPCWRRFFGGV